MVTSEHRVGQVIETPSARRATIPLPTWLGAVMTILDDILLITMRARHAIGPAQLTHHFIALAIVNQSVNRNRHPRPFRVT